MNIASLLFRLRPAEIYRERRYYRRRVKVGIAILLVPLYRPWIRRVTSIAVTGSCGKTTTKELIGGTLATKFRGTQTVGNNNLFWHIALAMLRVRPSHRYSVHEIGIGNSRGPLFAKKVALIKPTIGVVTNIGTDHIAAFGTREAIAEEKGKLVEALPSHGVAVLNADDPLVMSMRARCKARVITYGLGLAADVRGGDIHCSWPDRLSFTVRYGSDARRVQTNLCGDHFVSSALATIATWIAMGLPLSQAADAMPAVQPFKNRMQPVRRSDGVTFVFDDAKSPLWAVPAALRFMRLARARRRYIVIGTLSDYKGASEKAYIATAREALRSAEHVIFVGSRASKSLPAGRDTTSSAKLEAIYLTEEGVARVNALVQPGDLVLLKGTDADRMEWYFDSPFPLSRVASEPAVPAPPFPSSGWIQVVIGLGNPGDRYRDTRHNVGHEVVELLARFVGASWQHYPEASIASTQLPGGTLHLVKPATYVNDSGHILQSLRTRLTFSHVDCVLVHDDMSLESGVVRARMGGNDGGHNGVRSMLSALGTIDVRRIKVGVGRPPDGRYVVDYVLKPMPPEELNIMRRAYLEAAGRTLTSLALHSTSHDEMVKLKARFDAQTASGSPAFA